MRVITLTTDFGTRDWFVGTMKGVMAGIAPEARIIDITHEVEPGDVRGGAFDLAAASAHFPDGTIHVAVIDPGVGSARRAIALRTARAVLVGPDNGVLSWAVRDEAVEEVRSLTNTDWFLHPVSQTFHGRDVFAPVAARLAAGAPFEEAGELVDEFVRLAWPALRRGEHSLGGEVVHVDRFGNAITNIPGSELPAKTPAAASIEVRCEGKITGIHQSYTGVGRGQALAIVGSSGLLELAVNAGDFADHFGVGEGTRVEVGW